MKTLSYAIVILMTSLFIPSGAQNNNEPDAILGTWITGSGKAHVEIRKFNNTYYGQIVWLKEPNDANGKPKTDKNNSDRSRHNNPILGLKMLLGFSYKGDKQWKDGTIYDPENGSTYSCKIEMTDANSLNIRGYVGVSLLGRTDVWKRIK
ncbi:MAG: DUF2147 domain-containing protein [Bacteroidota bacterium]